MQGHCWDISWLEVQTLHIASPTGQDTFIDIRRVNKRHMYWRRPIVWLLVHSESITHSHTESMSPIFLHSHMKLCECLTKNKGGLAKSTPNFIYHTQSWHCLYSTNPTSFQSLAPGEKQNIISGHWNSTEQVTRNSALFDSPRRRARSSCILIISATGRSAATPIDIDSTLSGKTLVFYAVV